MKADTNTYIGSYIDQLINRKINRGILIKL